MGSEVCSGVAGHYGNIGGKAGVSVGPAVHGGLQVSFNFDGCTWSTSFDGDVHVLVGVELGGIIEYSLVWTTKCSLGFLLQFACVVLMNCCLCDCFGSRFEGLWGLP